MSFSLALCRHFSSFTRRYHLIAWYRHLFAFLCRFYLCAADTFSLSYVVFTGVVPTLLVFHTPLSLNCVVPTLVRFLMSVLLVWCRHFFAFLCRFHWRGADTFRFLTPFSLAWCRHSPPPPSPPRFLMSFFTCVVPTLFAFLRRFHLRGANPPPPPPPLSYVVFHLCRADTFSLSYAGFTCVVPTVSSLFYAVFTCVVWCFSLLRRFHLRSADTCSLFYVVFTYVVPTLLRFLMSFLPAWCRQSVLYFTPFSLV